MRTWLSAIVRKHTSYIPHCVLSFDKDNTQLCGQYAIVPKRTWLSAIVRKHTSYSVKHRRHNQPFQHQA
jgi:hypothetical protein